jgi:hypothetical protein
MVTPTVLKEWTVPMAAVYENPAPKDRKENGSAVMQLFSDNSLKYTLTVSNRSGNDQLVNAYLHTGNVITSGPVVLSFKSGFNGSTATGTISGVRQSLVDSLKSDANEIYINVQSAQVGSGLVRGQLNATLDWAMDVSMYGENVVPAVNVECSGLGLFRLTSDKNYTLSFTRMLMNSRQVSSLQIFKRERKVKMAKYC